MRREEATEAVVVLLVSSSNTSLMDDFSIQVEASDNRRSLLQHPYLQQSQKQLENNH